MKLSARNVLKGKVKSIKQGAVNSEVVIQLADVLEMISVITKTSTENREPRTERRKRSLRHNQSNKCDIGSRLVPIPRLS